MGLALDTPHALTTALTPADLAGTACWTNWSAPPPASGPKRAKRGSSASLAQTQADAAHSALLPQVSFRAAYEADRERFVTRGGANWLAGVSLRWNIFNGFADKSKIEESSHLVRQAAAQGQRIDSGVRLQVRRAYADLRAAGQRIEVARAAMAEAEESLRITQNRYEAGMNNVTDLLRNETAALESHTRYLAAVHDQRVAALLVEFAAGRLAADSEVFN